MKDVAFEVDLTQKLSYGPVEVKADDDLYYRFVSTGTSVPASAVLKLGTMRTANEPPLEHSSLTIDGTVGTVSIDGFAYITFFVSTTEAAKYGDLHIFTRKTQE